MPLLQRFFKRGESESAMRVPGAALSAPLKLKGKLRATADLAVLWLPLVWLVLLILVPLGFFGWLFFKTDTFLVQAVTVLDAQPNTEAAVKDLAETQLNNAALGRNIFFFQTDVLESKIKDTVPQTNTVRVERKLPDTLLIVIQEKNAALLLVSGGKYYLMDTNGIPYAVAQLDTLPGTVLPTIKNDDQAANVVLGASALAPSFVQFIQTAGEQLPRQIDAQVAEIHIPSLGTREVYFYLNNNWQIRFDVTRDVTQQLNLLKRVTAEIIPPEDKPKVEYVDLRIPNRIYYKLRGAK